MPRSCVIEVEQGVHVVARSESFLSLSPEPLEAASDDDGIMSGESTAWRDDREGTTVSDHHLHLRIAIKDCYRALLYLTFYVIGLSSFPIPH
jgi:hypothetical protein